MFAATCILALATAASAAVAAPATPPLRATFIGNMAFAITDGRTTIYTDFPYQSGYAGYMTYDFASVPKAPGALCLVTHGHLDHFDPSLFAKMDAKLIAPSSVEAKVPADRTIPFAPKMHYRVVEIEGLTTPHGHAPGTYVDHASYLVTWHGRRLYFTGDTESADQLLAMKNLDYAFVSPWLLEAVEERKGRIDARVVVLYHHRADTKVSAAPNRIVPKQGETLTLEAAPAGAGAAPR
jgi:L-ascorbate metabolism protein UlaG (beta-lactamase superfamily)